MSRRGNFFKVRIFSTWTSISISTARVLAFHILQLKKMLRKWLLFSSKLISSHSISKMLKCKVYKTIMLPVSTVQWKWVPGTLLGVKAAGAWGWQPHHLCVPNVMESGSLNLLEPSGPHRACYGIPLPFYLQFILSLTAREKCVWEHGAWDNAWT
jgi:hypothetical protein